MDEYLRRVRSRPDVEVAFHANGVGKPSEAGGLSQDGRCRAFLSLESTLHWHLFRVLRCVNQSLRLSHSPAWGTDPWRERPPLPRRVTDVGGEARGRTAAVGAPPATLRSRRSARVGQSRLKRGRVHDWFAERRARALPRGADPSGAAGSARVPSVGCGSVGVDAANPCGGT